MVKAKNWGRYSRARTLLWLKLKAGEGIQGLGLFYG